MQPIHSETLTKRFITDKNTISYSYEIICSAYSCVYCRKAVKATAILMPPFGLLLLFTVYSPDSETNYRAKLLVDCVAAPIFHLQVSVAFRVTIIVQTKNIMT